MAYATLAEVRARGDFDAGNTGQDSTISALLVSAEAAIDAWTNNTFEVTSDTTQKFDASEDVDGQSLYFESIHGYNWLADIISVTNGDASVIASSDYVTYPRNTGPYYGIKLLSGVSWTYTTNSENAIEVVGKWGYSEAVPAAINEACILLVLHWLRMSDQSEPDDMPKDVKMLLAPYMGVL